MAMSIERANGKCCLKIDGDLTIYTVKSIKDEFMEQFASCGEMELDLSQVYEIDTAGIQLLLFVKLEAARLHKSLLFVSASLPIAEIAELYQLVPQLDPQLLISSSIH